MGSLTSRPSLPPAQPQVVFAQSAPNPSAMPSTPTPTPQSANTDTAGNEETASQTRRQSLLGRERSRFGTIRTGFRGLLGLSDNAARRKTLLGE